MTGFEIALSLFVLCAILFYGRYVHEKEATMTDDEFQRKLRDRSYD